MNTDSPHRVVSSHEGARQIRYFRQFDHRLDQIFAEPPQAFAHDAPRTRLAHSLGATLYAPANRKHLSRLVLESPEITSLILCLEDALGDDHVGEAEDTLAFELQNLSAQLRGHGTADMRYHLPLLFLRVRSPEHLRHCARRFGRDLGLFTGVVLPKVSPKNAAEFFAVFDEVRARLELQSFYAMPVLESPEIIQRETRLPQLEELRGMFSARRSHILNLRFGAIDFCGVYGLRRTLTQTIYDVHMLAELVSDLVNIFSSGTDGFVISGGVFEHYWNMKQAAEYRNAAQACLLKEVQLDKLNGLVGKSVIHPCQLPFVQSCLAISYEDHMDALSIMGRAEGDNGAQASPFANKMNEAKPHARWARRTLLHGEIYGVLAAGVADSSLRGH